jgi:hypothetical protein
MSKVEYTTYIQTPKGFMCDFITTRSIVEGSALIRTIMRTVRRRMASKDNAWRFSDASVAIITKEGKKVGPFVEVVTVAEVKL